MRSSDEVQLNRKTSLLDGASDSEDEDERPLQQSQEADAMQQAAEVYMPAGVSQSTLSAVHVFPMGRAAAFA